MSPPSFARQVLIDGDAKAFKRHWRDVFPQFADQEPKTVADAEIALHIARTQSSNIPLKLRAWSHRWLSERGHPSFLPATLRPRAEQLCPVIASAVGIAVRTNSPTLRPALTEIRGEMEKAVLEAAADNKLEDSAFVRERMNDARVAATHRLFGNIGGIKS